MKKTLIIVLLACSAGFPGELPLVSYKSSDTSKPILLYLSGDGGWNHFSTALMQELNQQGYAVVGFNTKSYFYNKKKPEEAAEKIGSILEQYKKEWRRDQVVLIGYSFGADVLPFIQNRLPENLARGIRRTILLSPSEKTDFETHLLEIAGSKSKNGQAVVDEINKLAAPCTIVFGTEESAFPASEITSDHVRLIKIQGGHHYKNKTTILAAQIAKEIQ